MYSKKTEKEKAITLRRQGFSYSEILREVKVAKSTLSLWFKEVELSQSQKQMLTRKKIEAALRGAKKRRDQRIELSNKVKREAMNEIVNINKETIKLLGAFLYWAEGNKQKEYNVSVGVKFGNSDPMMIRFFYKWLIEVCEISSEQVHFELYIHENADIEKAKKFWAQFIPIDVRNLLPVRWKKIKYGSHRKNAGMNYNGVIRINVRRSTNLNRKIMAWVEKASQYFLD